jgi:glutamate-1-semialdehyde 2,1-aminomutase
MSKTDTNRGLTELDSRFYEKELASFLPDRIFDAHTHLWKAHFANWSIESEFTTVGYEEYMQLMQDLHPRRHTAALFLPVFEESHLIDQGNAWVAEQTAKDRKCRGLFFVRPQDDPEWVREQVRTLGLHGWHQALPHGKLRFPNTCRNQLCGWLIEKAGPSRCTW